METQSRSLDSPKLWLVGTLAAAFGLVGIGEKYPFSPFPMYAKIEPEADVLYIADQAGKPLAISSLFDVGSAQAKKRFEKELYAITKKRDFEAATQEQVSKAGSKFLQTLWNERKVKKTEGEGITMLQAKIITVSVAKQGGFDKNEHLLAKISVQN